MLVVTPKSVDQTLFHEIIYELSLLYQKQYYFLLVCSVFSYILFVLLVKIIPVQAAHPLNAVSKVVRCCHIQIPLKALTDQKALHFYKLIETEAVANESLGVFDAWLVGVLLVQFGCKKDATEGY